MTNYGQTWWGREWLKALSHIDYSNRLPRGRSYANKGAVRNIDMIGNSIEAKVQGKRPFPYKVKLSIPEFSKHEKAAFTEAIMAGGTGLNLTAASHVIHYDLWWNPAVENQATDRAYRIGQHKNVMVYRMITKGTFEEKINAMLQSKKELADLSISRGEQWVGNLSNRELRKVFAKE